MKELKEEKKAKEEEVGRLLKENREHQSAVQVLKDELDHIKRFDKEQLQRLESQKKEFELVSQEKIQSLELQLHDSYEKLEELKANAAREMSSLRVKDTQYQTFLSSQLSEYRVYFYVCLHLQPPFQKLNMLNFRF